MSSSDSSPPRAQWSRKRTFLFLIVVVATAVLAGYVAGYLALVLVIIVGVLIASYLGTDRFANWRSGRPSRARRQLAERLLSPRTSSGQSLRAEPDAVESWLRERSLHGVFDDRDED
jgi:Flp pilus assembly protein TadB